MSEILTVDNFSGGIVDAYIDGPPAVAKTLDNLVITTNSKIGQRPGIAILDDEHDLTLNPTTRISELFESEQSLYARQGTKVFWKLPDNSWEALTSEDTSDFMEPYAVDADKDYVTTAEWNGHTVGVTGQWGIPFKIYKPDANTSVIESIGLPARTITSSTALTGLAAGTDSYAYAIIPVAIYEAVVDGEARSFRVDGIPSVFSVSVNGDIVGDGDGTITGADTAYITHTLSTTTISNANTGENWQLANIGWDIYRTLKNGSTFFRLRTDTLTPVIANGGSTTFYDDTPDSMIENNPVIYTDGGTLENGEPPFCSVIDICNSVLFMGNIRERARADDSNTITTKWYPNRCYHSVQGALDLIPGDYFFDVDAPIKVISHAGKIPLIFCEKKLYRVDGFVDEFGQGAYIPEKISDAIGCIAPKSVVRLENIVYFMGNDGFYATDGYKLVKVSNHLNTTFQESFGAMTVAEKVQVKGELDVLNQRIHWLGIRDEDSTDNDFIWTIDTQAGLSQNMPTTTWSWRAYDDQGELLGHRLHPTAITIFNGELLVAGEFTTDFDMATTEVGIYKFSTSNLSDSSRDGTKFAIIYDYESSGFSFGTSATRKFVSKCLITMANRDDISIQPYSNNNDGTSVKALRELRYRRGITWGLSHIEWGDADFIWGFSGVLEALRRFPAGELRCTYKQLRLTNSFTIIENSDYLGTATVAASTPGYKTCLFDNPATADWPTDSMDYYLTFESDGYTEVFVVTDVSADTLTFRDPGDIAQVGSGIKWELKGYKKDEQFELLSYVLYFTPLSPSHKTFSTSELGQNA